MRPVLICFLIFLFLYGNVYPQDKEKTGSIKSVHISGSFGTVYNITNRENAYSGKFTTAFSLGIVKDFWNEAKNYIGIEIIGYKTARNKYAFGSEDKLSYWSYLIYKRRSIIHNNIILEAEAGLSFLGNSSDPWLLAPLLNFKLLYSTSDFDFFVKNSFRSGSLFFYNEPWIFTVGMTAKL